MPGNFYLFSAANRAMRTLRPRLFTTASAVAPKLTAPLTYAKMAKMAYVSETDMDQHAYQKTLKAQGWQCLGSHDGESDYRSLAYAHDESHEVIIAHRGTVLSRETLGSLKADVVSVVNKEIHPHVISALDHVLNDEVKLRLKESYQLSHTGHSLGGFLSTFATYIHQRADFEDYFYANSKAVVFDPVGSLLFLQAMEPRNAGHGLGEKGIGDLNVTHYVSYPNYVNAYAKHAGGSVYHLQSPTLKEKLGDFGLKDYQLETHRLDNLIQLFDEESGQPIASHCQLMSDWPLIDLSGLTSIAQDGSLAMAPFRFLKGWAKRKLFDKDERISYPTELLGGPEYQNSVKKGTAECDTNTLYDSLLSHLIPSPHDPQRSRRSCHFSSKARQFLHHHMTLMRGNHGLQEAWQDAFQLETSDMTFLDAYEVDATDWIHVGDHGSIQHFQESLYYLLSKKESSFLQIDQFAKEYVTCLHQGYDRVHESLRNELDRLSSQIEAESAPRSSTHIHVVGGIYAPNSTLDGVSINVPASVVSKYQKSFEKVLSGNIISVGPGGIFAEKHYHLPPKEELSSKEISNVRIPGGVESLYSNNYQIKLSTLLKKNRVVCLHGAGGCGKSILAQHEAIRKNSPYGLCYQITASSDDALLADLKGLYDHFYGQGASSDIQQDSLLTRVNAKISQKTSPCLLLLDNCQQVSQLLREVIDRLRGARIVITTRDDRLLRERDRGMAHLSLQKGWELEERLQFLVGWGSLEEREALANYLPFPLGLKIAAQTIRYLRRQPRRNYTYESYLSKIRSGISDRHEKKALQAISEEIDWRQTQTALLEESMRLISSESGQCLLQFLGYLSPFLISFDLVNCYFDHLFVRKSESERLDLLDDGLEQLRALSLVTEELQEGKVRSLGIHELVQDIARREFPIREKEWLPEHKNRAAVISETLSVSVSTDKRLLNQEEKRQYLQDCQAHLKAFLYHHTTTELYIGRAYFNLGNSYLHLGQANEAKDSYVRARLIKEYHYGENHVEVTRTLVNLGSAYAALGQPATVKKLLEKALKIQRAHYVEDNIDVAKTLGTLGNAFGALQQPKKMKELLESALLIIESHCGQNDVDVAITLVNLASAYGVLGQPKKKKDLLERALNIEKTHYDTSHVEVAKTLNNLGCVYGDLGQPEKMKEFLEGALPIIESYYGSDHVEVLKILGNLTNVDQQLVGAAQEECDFLKVYDIFDGNYGLDTESRYTKIVEESWSPLKGTAPKKTKNKYSIFQQPGDSRPSDVTPESETKSIGLKK